MKIRSIFTYIHTDTRILDACVGGMGVLWSVMWFFLIYDTPAKHPRIDPEEQEYIIKACEQGVQSAGDVSDPLGDALYYIRVGMSY